MLRLYHTPAQSIAHSQDNSLQEAIANIKEAAELYLETLSEDELQDVVSQEILTTAVEVQCV